MQRAFVLKNIALGANERLFSDYACFLLGFDHWSIALVGRREHMTRFMFGVLVAAIWTCLVGASFAETVQWPTEDGGNGHWYLRVDSQEGYAWDEAASLAGSMGGYLVSITSAEEDYWVYNNLDGYDRWIGAWQNINSPDYSEPNGGWEWLSGEVWSYTNWNGGGPDNNGLSEPSEEYGAYCCDGAWNDIYSVDEFGVVTRKNLIVEFSADCNGDGVVDYGQIQSGALADSDQDGIPDVCEVEAPVQWAASEGGNGHWYAVDGQNHIYSEASLSASGQGGHLAAITSASEDAFVDAVIASSGAGGVTDFWIGGFQPDGSSEPGGNWQWVTGEQWSFTDWAAGEPDDSGSNGPGDQQCLEIVSRPVPGSEYRWEDEAGSESCPFVIEWSADCNGDGVVDYGQILNGELIDSDGNGIPDVCELGQQAVQWAASDGGNGNWYQPVLAPGLAWSEARDQAAALGGHLATLASTEENTFVYELVEPLEAFWENESGNGPWLGGYQDLESPDYSEPSGGWTWVTGEPFDYTNWSPGQPDDSGNTEHCLHLHTRSAATWNDHFETVWAMQGLIIEYSADCNADGIVDYGQILNGDLVDADGNGIPDICEGSGGDDDGILNVPSEYASIGLAIDVAQNGDLVLVGPGTYTSSHPAHVIDTQGKLLTIESTDGPSATIIDGEGVRRGLACTSGESAGTTITGFTFANGSSVDDFDYDGNGQIDYWETYGGGFICANSSPQLFNCVIIGNTAAADGGGVCSYNSGLRMFNCTIASNTTHYGGGVYCEGGTTKIESCTLANNVASKDGGAIYCWNSSGTEISSCLITDNTAANFGAGVCCYESSARISAGIITQNITTLGSGSGGGGIACLSHSSPEITSCTISTNSSGWGGGGIYCHDESNASIANCSVENNTVTMYGGGIYCGLNTTANIQSTLVSGNSSTSEDGGGIWCSTSSDITVAGCDIVDNTAQNDGGGISCKDSSPTIIGCNISSNSTVHDGGGIYCEGTSNIVIEQSELLNNTAGWGGGLFAWTGSPTITNCTIEGNSVTQQGGGLYCRTGSSPSVSYTSISTNTAQHRAGGIYLDDSTSAFFEECSIKSNHSGDSGGGVYCYKVGGAIFEDCVVMLNTCAGRGGGFYCNESSPVITGGWLGQNTADDIAGGLYADANANPSLGNLIICGNIPDDVVGNWTDLGGNVFEPICASDCNENGVPDDQDIGTGFSYDCDQNNIPDECQNDCDGDGLIDGCDTEPDQDGNGVPDNCDPDCNENGIADGVDIMLLISLDCNTNGIPDECDIADGVSWDCNGNSLPDECEMADDPSLDCDSNGLLDQCEIGGDTDCNGNGILDVCDPDCNGNGQVDECELAEDPSVDCDQDGVIDTCAVAGDPSLDCDGDGLVDTCQIAGDPALDCDENGLIDGCDIAADPDAFDCDGDGVVDSCAIDGGLIPDCDEDGIPDSCNFANGGDYDGDGVLEDCECQGDIANGEQDGVVNIEDLLAIIGTWGSSVPYADINHDGTVNIEDMLIVLANWGICPS